MSLKPQDTLLALKYWSQNRYNQHLSVRELAESVGLSPGEVSKSTKRLEASHLVSERSRVIFADSRNLMEWIAYGVRYAYPLEQEGYGRGIATSWSCPLIESEMLPPNPAWVWPLAGGRSEGVFIKPFYSSVPFAANKDEQLYRVLSIVEAIRGGKPREIAIARDLASQIINNKGM